MSAELVRKLKLAREQLGVTQKEMAARLGVSYNTLVSWENDARTPSALALEALNAKLDSLLQK
ncbi:helix-turn-helix transcriptional regulator [Verrucomicrobium sp. BvORR034]|uniref:helix-turn-helix transcriptional regulator n=1 Tax=Verrucomicrobium sp. BvORR034 TaxID=1396418 RepID=UPI0006784793|nr:helix-turn-helix transcriptional regulator [Verrucomicrobium sp. BvORR034]